MAAFCQNYGTPLNEGTEFCPPPRAEGRREAALGCDAIWQKKDRLRLSFFCAGAEEGS